MARSVSSPAAESAFLAPPGKPIARLDHPTERTNHVSMQPRSLEWIVPETPTASALALLAIILIGFGSAATAAPSETPAAPSQAAAAPSQAAAAPSQVAAAPSEESAAANFEVGLSDRVTRAFDRVWGYPTLYENNENPAQRSDRH